MTEKNIQDYVNCCSKNLTSKRELLKTIGPLVAFNIVLVVAVVYLGGNLLVDILALITLVSTVAIFVAWFKEKFILMRATIASTIFLGLELVNLALLMDDDYFSTKTLVLGILVFVIVGYIAVVSSVVTTEKEIAKGYYDDKNGVGVSLFTGGGIYAVLPVLVILRGLEKIYKGPKFEALLLVSFAFAWLFIFFDITAKLFLGYHCSRILEANRYPVYNVHERRPVKRRKARKKY